LAPAPNTEPFPISVVTDDYAGPGPAVKRGALIRGIGRFTDDGCCFIRVDPDRIVEWEGVETSSSRP
jgi:hypothetical protein